MPLLTKQPNLCENLDQFILGNFTWGKLAMKIFIRNFTLDIRILCNLGRPPPPLSAKNQKFAPPPVIRHFKVGPQSVKTLGGGGLRYNIHVAAFFTSCHLLTSKKNKTKVISANILDFDFDLEDIIMFGNISVFVTTTRRRKRVPDGHGRYSKYWPWQKIENISDNNYVENVSDSEKNSK